MYAIRSYYVSKSTTDETGIYSPNTIIRSKAIQYSRSLTVAKRIENIAYSLAAKRSGLTVDSSGLPKINNYSEANAYQNQLNAIRNVSKKLSYSSSYCYSQTGIV